MASLSPKARFIIVGIVTLLFIIAGFAVVSYHAEFRCKGEKGASSTTDCGDGWKEWCPSAYGFNLSQSGATWTLRCPWEPETAALGILGCISALSFLGVTIFFLRKQGKKLRIALFVTLGLSLVLLIISFILMIRDMSRAYKWKREHTGSAVEHFRPASYIINMILFIIAIGLICAYSILGYKRLGPKKETSYKAKQPPKPEAVYEPQVPKQDNYAPEIKF